MEEQCRTCTQTEAECAMFCIHDEDVPMMLHTQYRVLLRHEEEETWLTLVTTDDWDMAMDDLLRLATDHGVRNAKMVAETRFCEAADFLT